MLLRKSGRYTQNLFRRNWRCPAAAGKSDRLRLPPGGENQFLGGSCIRWSPARFAAHYHVNNGPMDRAHQDSEQQPDRQILAAWFSDRNCRVVIFARAEVACTENFLNNSRNLLPSPNVVQALSQCRTVAFRGELLQEICGNRVWSPAFQLQCEVIDNLARIVEGHIQRNVSSEQIFGQLDLFHFVEEIETGLLHWVDSFLQF